MNRHSHMNYPPREDERLDIEFGAFVAVERQAKLAVVVGDVSSGGFRCRCAKRLPIGRPVVLKVAGVGEFPATIAWQLGVDAGARFVEPLPQATIMRIILSAIEAKDAAPEGKPKAKKRAAV